MSFIAVSIIRHLAKLDVYFLLRDSICASFCWGVLCCEIVPFVPTKIEMFLRSKFNCFLMLTFVQVGILLTIVFAAIGVPAWIVEILLTLHASRIISIQKRSDEFIKLSRKYYLQLAFLVGRIQAETDPKYTVRPRILFFNLAKFLSFYYNFLDKMGGVWIFPKKTQETEVSNDSQSFYSFINLSIFNDDREVVERVINW